MDLLLNITLSQTIAVYKQPDFNIVENFATFITDTPVLKEPGNKMVLKSNIYIDSRDITIDVKRNIKFVKT